MIIAVQGKIWLENLQVELHVKILILISDKCLMKIVSRFCIISLTYLLNLHIIKFNLLYIFYMKNCTYSNF